MNRATLKDFAIDSRKNLIERVKIKLNLYYINESFEVQKNGDIYILTNSNHSLSLTNKEYEQRELLLKRVKEVGLDIVIEEAAYTWFNRLIAIRYMEVNDFLPLGKNNENLGIRVLSSNDNTPNPEILKFSNLFNEQLDLNVNKEIYSSLNDENEKFKYILLLVCNKLKQVIPAVFDGVTDYIDLLIPEKMLSETGFITKLIRDLPEEDFAKVEIIGWLYQYYNQTEKDRVINAKQVYKKNEIAYATQLFTPDWIVKYIVENSLGKYIIEHSDLEQSSFDWEFFVNKNITKGKSIDPTNITLFDPCSGSGHILVYAFDLLYKCYEQYGYNKKEISARILKDNLFGLDIDDRAGQLTILSVLLKAREYDKDIFKKDIIKELNVFSIQESNTIDYFSIENITNEEAKSQAKYLYDLFKNAKEIGSLLIPKENNFKELIDYLNNNNDIFTNELKNKIMPLIRCNNLLANKYSVVATNPPYMNDKYMGVAMKDYAITNYKPYKSDLFSMFFIKMFNITNEEGYVGVLSPFVWMFIKSYENLRKYIINNKSIDSLVQLEYNAFEAACVPVGTFVFKNHNKDNIGTYIKLSDFPGSDIQEIKVKEALTDENCKYRFEIDSKRFNQIPSYLIAYWLPERMFEVFSTAESLDKYGEPKQGMATTDNKTFLRLWFELNKDDIKFDAKDTEDAKDSGIKWFPYNKGGEYRKWYGNNSYVVNYFNDGEEIKRNVLKKYPYLKTPEFVVKNSQSYFKKGITWSYISSTNFGVRYSNSGFIFDVSGSCIFPKEEYFDYLMGLLCSKLSTEFLNIINPTMNIQAGSVGSIPTIINMEKIAIIKELVKRNIEICKKDWDENETSWDFEKSPIIGLSESIENACKNYINAKKDDFAELKNNEEQLNKIYFDIYGVSNEFDYHLSDDEITMTIKNEETLVKDLINFSVGCMFGRYSIDKLGLVCSSNKIDKNNYVTFEADDDNIIPISDSESIYYDDDIVGKFKKFIKNVFGEKTLNLNLEYIADVLGRKGTELPEETIRRYFVNDFYNYHCDMYSVNGSGKRPIYWLVDSGKKNGFKALFYVHRYDQQLMSKIRVNYLHKTQDTYERIKEEITYKLSNGESYDIKEMRNKLTLINSKIEECRIFEEKLGHYANQMIKIDLNDGVKDNYDKFKDILAKVK